MTHRSRSVPAASGSSAKSDRAEALGVRVEDPERVGVPEGEEELADRLAHGLDREPVPRPGLLRGQVVPAEGVGAVGGDHVPGLDDVAAALRHLLALGVEDQPEADAVAIAGGVEEQRRLGQQRVEPAAGLVDRLADEVGREALLELLLVLERVVELRERHRAAVVPGVDHRIDPAHLAAALLAGHDDVVDVGAVEVVGDVAAGALAELGDRADAGALMAALAAALPDRQRRPPVAVAGERPVDVVLEPFAEPAVLDVLGVPPDLLVVGEQAVALARGRHVPARLRVVEERGAAAPAVRVGVLVDLLAEQQAALGEVVDQARGHLRVLDEASLEPDDPVVELAVGGDRVVERRVLGRVEDPVLGGDRVVVLAEGRGDVDEAGPVLGGDEIAGDDREPALLAVGEVEDRAPVAAADQVRARGMCRGSRPPRRGRARGGARRRSASRRRASPGRR